MKIEHPKEISDTVNPLIKNFNKSLKRKGLGHLELAAVHLTALKGTDFEARICTIDSDNVQHCFPPED